MVKSKNYKNKKNLKKTSLIINLPKIKTTKKNVYIQFSAPLIFLAPPLVEELFRVASDVTFFSNFNNNPVFRDNNSFLYDFVFSLDFAYLNNVEIPYFNFFFVEFFHVDFVSVNFSSTTPIKDFFFFLNTFFFSMFIELDYAELFLFPNFTKKLILLNFNYFKYIQIYTRKFKQHQQNVNTI